MTRPTITVVSTTWAPAGPLGEARVAAAMVAAASWNRHLQYDGPLALHTADDGSVLDEPDEIASVWDRGPVTHSRQERRGVGASLNAGCAAAFRCGGLALYVVDDWLLTGDLDLTPWADLLGEREDVAAVRLGPPHPWTRGQVEHDGGRWFLRLDRYAFAFGHRPALYHARMFQAYGPFREGVTALECEARYRDVVNTTPGPDVALAIANLWQHVDSFEASAIVPRA